ncbi:MAG: MnhB domain-containing protein, partial [Halobacteria archaeon]|nr:MnhB domain-containing protein [Halobacteria archaeon]
MTTVILRTTAKVTLPIVLLYSLTLFLQGHNLPGGGFIAGVLTAVGVSLVYMAYSTEYIRRKVFEGVDLSAGEGVVGRYRRVFLSGLVIALVSGFGAVALGYPFLSQSYVVEHLPLYGEVEIASAVAFDLGVYV